MKCKLCAEPIHERKTGLCDKHYRRVQRHSDPNKRYGHDESEFGDTCKVCGKPADVKSRSLCYTHYKRWQRTGDETKVRPRGGEREAKYCTIEGCSSPHRAKGYCFYHYSLWKRNGSPERLPKKKGWGTGQPWLKERKEGGYDRMIHRDGKSIKEHRYIMEQHLGRKLSPDEYVHHKDGDPLNNDINNLEILSPEEHSRLHAKQRWSRLK